MRPTVWFFLGDMRKIENLDEEGFGRFNVRARHPGPGSHRRTSGEERLSNFLLSGGCLLGVRFHGCFLA